jgi:hypothetical protein
MMPMFAPEYAAYSPIAIHHLLLVEQLHRQGVATLDLTPGPDPFKDRFAGTYDDVSVLSIYFKQSAWIKAKIRKRGVVVAKEVVAILGMARRLISRNLPPIRAWRPVMSNAFPRWKRARPKLSYD